MAGSVIIGGKSYSGGSSIPDEVIVSSPASTSAEVRTSTNSTFRLGRQSSVRMRKRESGLLRGSALVSSGRGLVGRRSESVRAGGARIDCRGTVLMAVNGDQVKVTCLEGGANVRLTETRGQFLRLEPGTMVLLESSSGVMPDRVEVDLERLTDTAALTCTHFGELPSSRSIRKAIARQRRDIEEREIARLRRNRVRFRWNDHRWRQFWNRAEFEFELRQQQQFVERRWLILEWRRRWQRRRWRCRGLGWRQSKCRRGLCLK